MNTSGSGEIFHFHAFYFVSGSCREGLIARGMWISDGAVDAQALRKFDGQSVEYVQCAATIDPSKEDSSNEWSATSSRWRSRILIYVKNCLKWILWATQILTMTTCLLTNDQRLIFDRNSGLCRLMNSEGSPFVLEPKAGSYSYKRMPTILWYKRGYVEIFWFAPEDYYLSIHLFILMIIILSILIIYRTNYSKFQPS